MRNKVLPGEYVLFAISFVLLLIFPAGCDVGKKAALVGKQPLRGVMKVESNSYELKAWIVNRAKADVLVHIDTSDELQIFPESHLENIRNAAAHLKRGNVDVLDQIAPLIEYGGAINLGYRAGLFKEMVWVLPAYGSVGDKVDNFKKYLMQRRRYTAEHLAGLTAQGRKITGTLAGVPITIVSLDDFTVNGRDVILSIDLGFFVGLKVANPSYQTGTRSLLNFLRTLADKKVKARFATIVLSTESGVSPMDIRFFGDIIKQALQNPRMLEEPTPSKWAMMIEAEDSLVAGNYVATEEIYEHLVETHPEDPGLHFALAITRGFMNKGEESSEALLRAYGVDGAYLKGFFQLANVLAVGGKIDTGLKIIDTPILSKIISPQEFNFQKGVFYMNGGRPADAELYLLKAAQEKPNDFALHVFLFNAQRGAGDHRGMAGTFDKLRELDRARLEAEVPWVFREMGAAYEAMHQGEEAAGMYEEYISLVPGDTIVQELRRKVDRLRAGGK